MLREESGGSPLIGQVVSGMEVAWARSAASVWNRRRCVRKHRVREDVGEGVLAAAGWPAGVEYRRRACRRTGL